MRPCSVARSSGVPPLRICTAQEASSQALLAEFTSRFVGHAMPCAVPPRLQHIKQWAFAQRTRSRSTRITAKLVRCSAVRSCLSEVRATLSSWSLGPRGWGGIRAVACPSSRCMM